MRIKVFILIPVVLFFSTEAVAQNISINTSGAANSTLSMLEVLQISTTANTKGLYVSHVGAGAANIAGYFTATGGTGNYAIIVPSGGGNVGIGTSTPGTRLDLGNAIDNKPVFRMHPGTATAVDYSGYAHNDFFMGSYIAGSYPQHYITFGYTADVNRKLHIGSGSNAAFDGTTVFSPAMTVTSGGYVGIGTTTPLGPLHVVGTLPNYVDRMSNVNNEGAHFMFRKARGTTSAPLVLQNGDEIGKFLVAGYDGSNYIMTGGISAVVNGAVAANSVPTDLVFGVSSANMGNPSTNEAMRITNTKKVGIGTTAPLGLLHLNATGQSAFLMSDVTTTGNQLGRIVYDGGSIVTGGGWVFQKMNDAGAFVANLVTVVQNTGNVGIGTITPSYLLDAVRNQNGYSLLSVRNNNAGTSALSGLILYNDQAAAAGIIGLSSSAFSAYPILGTNKIFIDANSSMNGIVLNNEGAQPIMFATSNTEKMRVDGNGRVGIGTSAPSYRLHVYNSDPTLIINSLSDLQPTLTGNQASNLHSNWSQINISSAFNFNCGLYAAVNRINLLGGQTGTTTATYGSVNDVIHAGSGNLGVGYGSYNAVVNSAGANIGTAVGSFAAVYNSGAGSITTAFGVYIPNVQATSKWSIYAPDAAAPSYLAGNLGIGNATPAYPLSVNGDASICGTVRYSGLSGACSDIRYKKELSPLSDALSNVLKLQGVNYFWKANDFPELKFSDRKQIGFIAQEIEKIYPELVLTDKEGYKSVDYSKLTPVLVEAIKEQQRLIETLTNKVNAMENALKTTGIPVNSFPSRQISSEKK